ncbi:MAG: branched-chain amino acid ABC transporter permease [Deltaproteobacteria bacterium]|nr:branched-chain amino acid ABC transporter permease [Deltaproteobacteria bacterium]MBW1816074.1 branched-chain amino acid ABC transporter permease [Deltaproteobacteria bacterium]MBW2285395.1 branched-chain amino acid ABC transporter permease [Deltaproteobacteria bacterium]
MGQVIINALMLGMTYVLMASGLSLVFGILQIVNFAHGQFYMVGAVVLYWLYMSLGLPYLIAVLLSTVVVGLLGIVVELVFLRRLLKAPIVAILGVVLGLMVGLEGLMELLFGEDDRNVKSAFHGVLRIQDLSLSYERLVIIFASLIVMGLLYFWIRYTREGTATRAVAQDRLAAELVGVDVGKTRILIMGIGSGLAATAGSLISPLFFVSPYVGTNAMLKSLIIITLGGMGSLPGAALGGLILGVIESFGQTYLGNITEMVGFLLVIIILLVKPQGLFGVPFEIAE